MVLHVNNNDGDDDILHKFMDSRTTVSFTKGFKKMDEFIVWLSKEERCPFSLDILSLIFGKIIQSEFIVNAKPMKELSNNYHILQHSSLSVTIEKGEWNHYLCNDSPRLHPPSFTPPMIIPFNKEAPLSGVFEIILKSNIPSDYNDNQSIWMESHSNFNANDSTIGVDIYILIQIKELSLISCILINKLKGKCSEQIFLEHPSNPGFRIKASMKDAFLCNRFKQLEVTVDIITMPIKNISDNKAMIVEIFGNQHSPKPYDIIGDSHQLSKRQQLVTAYPNVCNKSMKFSEYIERICNSLYLEPIRDSMFSDPVSLNQFSSNIFKKESKILGLDIFARILHKHQVVMGEYALPYHYTFGSFPTIITFDHIENQDNKKYHEMNNGDEENPFMSTMGTERDCYGCMDLWMIDPDYLVNNGDILDDLLNNECYNDDLDNNGSGGNQDNF